MENHSTKFFQGLVEDAQELWSLISNPKYTKVKALPHDAYLKIWLLQEPLDLHQTEKVDCIILKDGQDFSDARLDAFLRRTSCPRIIFGDFYQQLHPLRKFNFVVILKCIHVRFSFLHLANSYRRNALNDYRLKATKTYHLTHVKVFFHLKSNGRLLIKLSFLSIVFSLRT